MSRQRSDADILGVLRRDEERKRTFEPFKTPLSKRDEEEERRSERGREIECKMIERITVSRVAPLTTTDSSHDSRRTEASKRRTTALYLQTFDDKKQEKEPGEYYRQ